MTTTNRSEETNKQVWEAGEALRKYASESEIVRVRGVINEIFPDIYEASKRMSTRAISRWLQEVQGVKLSPATISKALREQGKYWLEYYEFIEPFARFFGESHGELLASEVLEMDVSVFDSLCHQEPTFAIQKAEKYSSKKREYDEAVLVLRKRWFALSEDTRDTCLGSVPADTEVEEQSQE